ncbi:hypothetical protein CC86DRAFT_336750 [Ophiobolus disseminans]|uniref:Large ribosomal subunit protein mL67 n=1 Tax=Ophiobolus disseminans TaxID=1469910 RepID=A0A6A6ZBZ3_9PLEO|nr:hypothetical protein CC86DRAFT_336750 [Ophiobolus disseminans]
MPRTLTRLRYRTPPKPINFARTINARRLPREGVLESQVAKYVARQSNPGQVRLQVIVNPKARRPATGQSKTPPWKPFTLRDVVDPDGKARHGEIVYIFRNTKSDQIIYSLSELLNEHHLDQLPFIGKHSKPPALRPDEWVPHCVLTFPTAEQGHNAYRKLREFRKLHELSWVKTTPHLKQMPIKQRIKHIMDQRANTSADIAAVLRIQGAHGAKMQEALNLQQRRAKKYLDKKWAEIDALANAATAKAKEADSVKWLEHQIRSLTMKLNMKHNQNEADQKRLKGARSIQEIRLRKIQYAQRKVEQFKTIQEGLTRTAAPAEELGAEGKLNELKDQASVLRKAVATLDPTRRAEDLKLDRKTLAGLEDEIATLEAAFEAKSLSEARNHHIARSVLPDHLKKALPTPYTLEGISVRWADVQDALRASGKWPELIEHEALDVNKVRNGTMLLSAQDFDIEVNNEVNSIVQMLQAQMEGRKPARPMKLTAAA